MADFGKLNFSVSFNPTSAFPLDARCYFESLTAAQAAAATADVAGSSTTTYYYGETLVVVENSVATMYVIQPDKTLAEVGGKIEINENVFLFNADEKLDLYGFAAAVAGAQLTKSADGKLSWVKPDTTTVEGLSTTVEGLRTDVGALQEDVESLQTEVGNKANASDVYTKDEVDQKISGVYHYKGSVATYANLPTDATVGDVYNVEAADKANGVKAGDNVAWNGTGWDILGGTVDLSAYATIEDVNAKLDKKVDKVEGSRLMTDAEGTKLADIEAGAEVNVLEAVKIGGTVLSVENKAVDIPVAGENLGTVKSSTNENGIAIDEAGTMSVNTVNVNKLVQTTGEVLILNGSSSVM